MVSSSLANNPLQKNAKKESTRIAAMMELSRFCCNLSKNLANLGKAKVWMEEKCN
jgi:hypothetical protein